MGFTDASSTIIQRPLAFGPPGGGGMGGGIGGLQPIGRPAAPMNGMRALPVVPRQEPHARRPSTIHYWSS